MLCKIIDFTLSCVASFEGHLPRTSRSDGGVLGLVYVFFMCVSYTWIGIFPLTAGKPSACSGNGWGCHWRMIN